MTKNGDFLFGSYWTISTDEDKICNKIFVKENNTELIDRLVTILNFLFCLDCWDSAWPDGAAERAEAGAGGQEQGPLPHQR